MAYGTEMKYIAIRIGTTISYQTFSYKEGDGIHAAYESLMQSQVRGRLIATYIFHITFKVAYSLVKIPP